MSTKLQTSQEVKEATKLIDELDLTPNVRAYLLALLSTWQELKFERDEIQHQMDIETASIGHLLEEAGVDKTKTADLNLFWVRGSTTSKLVKEKLIAQGVTLAQIEAATVTKPKKDYFQIRGKSEKPFGAGEE